MSRKGYTLLELVVALAIASIIMALAIHNFSAPSPRRELHAAGQTLIRQLRLARQKAITDGQESVVSFNVPDVNQYEHPVLGTTTLPRNVQFCPTCDPNHPDGISFGTNKATFEPDGTIGGTGSIFLMSTLSTDTFVITVNKAGRIEQSPGKK